MSTKAEILRIIREKCVVDCCCGSVKEVATCQIETCALHPFRMGRDPTPSRSGENLKTSSTQDEFSENNTELMGTIGVARS